MARKAKHPAHANHERWLVSYADFMTLLFAFFVVMFAKADQDKAKKISQAFTEALEHGQLSTVVANILSGKSPTKGKTGAAPPQGKDPAAAANPMLAELLPSLEYLSAELKDEIAAGKVHVEMHARGLVVSLMEAAFFPSGEARIVPGALPSIAKIAGALKKIPNPVRLEGHTDSVPIHNSRFQSNWDLSAARGVAMLELFTTQYGIAEDRLAIVGYADHAPVDTNETDAGRARNRRVDLVILNEVGLAGEPESKNIHTKQGERPGAGKSFATSATPAKGTRPTAK
jgi:chemotaxis protein MotB